MVSTSIRMSEEVRDRLDFLAKRTGRTKTYYIQEAIAEKLEDLELYYLAEERLKKSRAGKSKTYTLDEVIKKYGLEDKV